MSRKATLFTVALTALLTLIFAQIAGAVSLPLTGGDATDGWAVPTPSSMVVAVDTHGVGTTAVQLITFTGNGDGGQTTSTNPFAGGSTNDVNLGHLLETQTYSVGAPLVYTISGLVNNVRYRVDQFMYAEDSGNKDNFNINGVDVNPTFIGETNNGPYVEEDIVLANSGQIVLTITNASTVARLNAYAIFALPEPASLGLLALGGGAMLRRSSRARKLAGK